MNQGWSWPLGQGCRDTPLGVQAPVGGSLCIFQSHYGGRGSVHPSANAPETSKFRPPKLRVPPPLFLLGQVLTLTLSLHSLTSEMGLAIPVRSQRYWEVE